MEQRDIEVPTYKTLTSMIWCWLWHRKWRKRTGQRRIRTATITYEIYCDKCHQYDRELVVPII